MFWTALSFEPSCLWINHQPSQTRRFNSRQHGLNSIQFLGSFRTCSVKSFSKFSKITPILAFLFLSEIPKKVFHFLNFIKIEILKILKNHDLDYFLWIMLSFLKKKKRKRKKNNGLYVSVRSWKPNVIIKNRGIDYLLFYSCILLENSIMAYLVWRLSSFSRIFIVFDNTCQQDNGKHCIN